MVEYSFDQKPNMLVPIQSSAAAFSTFSVNFAFLIESFQNYRLKDEVLSKVRS